MHRWYAFIVETFGDSFEAIALHAQVEHAFYRLDAIPRAGSIANNVPLRFGYIYIAGD